MYPIRQQLAIRLEAVLPALGRRVGTTRRRKRTEETRLLERAGAIASLLTCRTWVPAGSTSYHGLDEGLPAGTAPWLGLDVPTGALECAPRAYRGR